MKIANLSNPVLEYAASVTGADRAQARELVQELWSGYGEIVRLDLRPGKTGSATAIVKYIKPPSTAAHPRGWNTSASHQRKLRSYEVESFWYSDWAIRCDGVCRVAKCYGSSMINDTRVLVLEDLDAHYPARCSHATLDQAIAVLQWLARFHARFLGEDPTGLWPLGTYWHLATRQDEYDAMPDGALKDAAMSLDQALSQCRFQTLVHGDAKIANFCFHEPVTDLSVTTDPVSAVDFQYVGGGCGIRDVVYFLGSCLTEAECEQQQENLLDVYFAELTSAALQHDAGFPVTELVAEWRALYAIAWTDFYRFLAGWMPDHPKVNSYTKSLAKQALASL